MKRGLTFIEGLFSLACIAIVVAVLWPNFLRGRARSKYIGCRGNLMELAAALDTYAADNNGYYPTSLQALAPRYLKAIPGCPAAGRDTYSADYASAELKPVEGVVHCSHGPYPGEKLSQDLQCGKQREELQAVARATSWSAAQQRHLSCPLGGSYRFQSRFTVQCTGDNHYGPSTPTSQSTPARRVCCASLDTVSGCATPLTVPAPRVKWHGDSIALSRRGT